MNLGFFLIISFQFLLITLPFFLHIYFYLDQHIFHIAKIFTSRTFMNLLVKCKMCKLAKAQSKSHNTQPEKLPALLPKIQIAYWNLSLYFFMLAYCCPFKIQLLLLHGSTQKLNGDAKNDTLSVCFCFQNKRQKCVRQAFDFCFVLGFLFCFVSVCQVLSSSSRTVETDSPQVSFQSYPWLRVRGEELKERTGSHSVVAISCRII